MSIHGRKKFQAGTVVLDDATYAAIDAVAPEHFEHDIRRADPVRQPAHELDAPDEGHPEPERVARYRERNFNAARSDRQHADRCGRGGMTVRAKESFSGLAET